MPMRPRRLVAGDWTVARQRAGHPSPTHAHAQHRHRHPHPDRPVPHVYQRARAPSCRRGGEGCTGGHGRKVAAPARGSPGRPRKVQGTAARRSGLHASCSSGGWFPRYPRAASTPLRPAPHSGTDRRVPGRESTRPRICRARNERSSSCPAHLLPLAATGTRSCPWRPGMQSAPRPALSIELYPSNALSGSVLSTGNSSRVARAPASGTPLTAKYQPTHERATKLFTSASRLQA